MAATRVPVWSIYNVLASFHFTSSAENIIWLEKPLLLIAGMGVFTWCIVREIEPALSSALAILVTLLFYRMGYPNYQMVLFSLVSYWAVSNWAKFKDHSVLAILLIGYFCFLTIVHLSVRWVLFGSLSFYIMHIVETVGALSQFLLGCALLICLVKLRL